jgi:hypothetical protein
VQRVAQRVGHLGAVEPVLAQIGQRLAKFLQVVRLLLQRRLAGPVVGAFSVAIVGIDAAVRGGASVHARRVRGEGSVS